MPKTGFVTAKLIDSVLAPCGLRITHNPFAITAFPFSCIVLKDTKHLDGLMHSAP